LKMAGRRATSPKRTATLHASRQARRALPFLW
jgi:hypothetical protein